MITIENADKALKDYYLEAFATQLNGGISPFFSAIEHNTNNVYGKDVKMAVVKEHAGNVMAGAEDGNLPAPYQNRYYDITVPLKNIYGTIEISDKALRASRDSTGAFVNLLNAEMEGLVSSAKRNFQRMLFGDGSGELCEITGQVSGKTYSVSQVKEYFTGMNVQLALNGTAMWSGSVVSVDIDNCTVTLNATIPGACQGLIMVPYGSIGNELTGLKALFDDTTLYGYDKTKESYFSPQKIDGQGTLTEDTLVDIIDRMEENYDSRINMIICSYKNRKKIAQLVADDRRVVNTIDANTGIGTVSVCGIPVIADKYCQEDRILFLNTEDFSLSQLCDWEWLEDEDGKILKQVPGKAAYSATLVKYAELICRKPCAQAMLYNFAPAA